MALGLAALANGKGVLFYTNKLIDSSIFQTLLQMSSFRS